MNINLVRPSSCVALHAWLLFNWDIHKSWMGPHKRQREMGFRFFGIEVSWTYVEGA